jgi:hypothetical protein
MKTFEEFRTEILDYAYNRRPLEWRLGQAVFNYIDKYYNVARRVQFIDKVDCFHNDELIDQFILLSYRQLCGLL